MPQRLDQLLDLAFYGFFVTFLACAAVLVAALVVKRHQELGPLRR